jgi:hypothetical protein
MLWSEPAPATLRTPRRTWLTAWDLGLPAVADAAVIVGRSRTAATARPSSTCCSGHFTLILAGTPRPRA